jgi:hypothetical protein
MNQPDCIAGFRHVLLYPYFAFGAAKIPMAYFRAASILLFLVERISY